MYGDGSGNSTVGSFAARYWKSKSFVPAEFRARADILFLQWIPFRHEIASLFFLNLVDRALWDPVIDMIIAHHKSVSNDDRKKGILDLEDEYGDEILEYHLSDFSAWSMDALGILGELSFPELLRKPS